MMMAETGTSAAASLPNGTESDSNEGPLVMIAVDASEQAENAFEYYSANLHQDTNRLLLVHIAEPPMVESSNGNGNDEKWSEMLAIEHEKVKELEDKYGVLMEGNRMSGRMVAVFSNKPGQTICRVADDEKVSMIIMGTRGLGVVRRTILGSVSDYVLHHANCPVVICHPV